MLAQHERPAGQHDGTHDDGAVRGGGGGGAVAMGDEGAHTRIAFPLPSFLLSIIRSCTPLCTSPSPPSSLPPGEQDGLHACRALGPRPQIQVVLRSPRARAHAGAQAQVVAGAAPLPGGAVLLHHVQTRQVYIYIYIYIFFIFFFRHFYICSGKDKSCFGRLTLTAPHATIHAYHKPHWHSSLLPWAPRVGTVRDKARVQGFPDHFVFLGTVDECYKQVANAVSPQLAIGIGRVLLSSLGGAHLARRAASAAASPAADAAAPPALPLPVWSPSLQNFADFLASFDEGALPQLPRRSPPAPPAHPRKLHPMTYEEVLVEYNTEHRSDHSVRYQNSAFIHHIIKPIF